MFDKEGITTVQTRINSWHLVRWDKTN